MATNKEYLEFILDQLSELDGITQKPMMGEYIIYYHGKIAAYLCDDRLLVKPVPSAVKLMPDAKTAEHIFLCNAISLINLQITADRYMKIGTQLKVKYKRIN